MAVFEDISEALQNPERVTALELYGDDLRPTDLVLPEAIGRLVNLERMHLDQWLDIRLPDSVASLPKLSTLVMEECAYQQVPEVVFACRGLRHLSLSPPRQGLMLPVAIRQLRQLSTLVCWGLRRIPDAIEHCRQLQALDISHGDFDTLPRALGNLPQLRSLDLSYTGVDELPRWLTSMSIEELRMDQGPAHIYPKWTRHKVQQIRQSWGDMRQLRELSLCYQHVIDVSRHVAHWERLHRLDLSYNDLDEAPEELALIPNLEILVLRANRLPDLPKAWQGWAGPRKIDLSQNPLEALPEVLMRLPNLEKVSLAGTPLAKGDRADLESQLPGVMVVWDFS